MKQAKLKVLRKAMKANPIHFKVDCNFLLGSAGYYCEHPENKIELYKCVKYILENNNDEEFEREFDRMLWL